LAAALDLLDRVRVVRYRPGRCCTIRAENGDVEYMKVYRDPRGARLYGEAQAVWDARDELEFAVARPAGFNIELRTVSWERVPGSPARDRLTLELAGRLGRAAASLARSSLEPVTNRGSIAQLARLERSCGRLRRLLPEHALQIDGILAQVRGLFAAGPPLPSRPIHGAPHLPQWLVDGDTPALVDFDRYGRGDPELDAATLAASLADVGGPELAEAALSGYEAVAEPLRSHLLRAYGAQHGVAKALNAARSIRADGDERARLRLAVVERALEDGR
jgi:aminoglycoside phosphotransferase (APT) family kinase protein